MLKKRGGLWGLNEKGVVVMLAVVVAVVVVKKKKSINFPFSVELLFKGLHKPRSIEKPINQT